MKRASCNCLQPWTVVVVVIAMCNGSTRGDIANIALNLSYSLTELFENSTRYLDLQQIYNDSASEATVTSINGSEMTDNIAAEILVRIRTIQKNLEEVASKIEHLYTSHNNSGCCSTECDKSLSSFDRGECDKKCDYDAETIPVNTQYSNVFTPLNIYKKDISVLCFAEWSMNITDVLVAASEELSEYYVPFIFFGDKSGVIKTTPEYDWGADSYSCTSCPYNCVNTYDPRSRQWYIDSASGTKHVVVLIDHSGSMTGSSFTRATLSSSELISNLIENDFFIVYRVGYDNTTIVGDSDKLLQASPENKLVVSKLISELPMPWGKADFDDSLNKAYDLLTNSSSQACHKLIFVFSDGNAVIPVDRFTRMNSGRVSVFTFLVDAFGKGDHLKELACKNKGRFTLLNDFNSIGLSIRILTVDLNQRSPNFTNAAFSQFTAAVINSLIITMSIPLKPFINNRTEFIGVVGLDTSESLFTQIILKAKIGPLGSSMLVTNNGHLYRHPLMHSSVFEYFDELRSFDFSQYEFIPDSIVAEELRRAIVNNESGSRTAESFGSVEHKKRYFLRNYTYYFRPLRTDIRLVVKLPSPYIHHLNYSVPLNTTILAEIKDLIVNGQYHQNHAISIVGFQPNCFNQIWYTLDNHNDAMTFINKTIEEVLANSNDPASSNCSIIYDPILRDLINVYQVVKGLQFRDGVESAFYQFTSGLLYCVLSDQATSFQCNHIVNSFVNFIALAEDNPDKLYVHRGTDGSVLFETVQLIQAITIPKAPNVSVGVAGLVVKSSYFEELLSPHVVNPNTSLYLVDNGGYSVGNTCYTNSSTSFLGSTQPYLFNALVNASIFFEQKVTGYHKRICKSPIDKENLTSSIDESTGINTMMNNSRMRNVLDLCVSDVHFYTLSELFSSLESTNRSGIVLTEKNSLYFTAINLPNTTSILISYESGCGYKEDTNGSLASPPLIGEYETSNFPEYFYTKASDETCPDTDNYMDC